MMLSYKVPSFFFFFPSKTAASSLRVDGSGSLETFIPLFIDPLRKREGNTKEECTLEVNLIWTFSCEYLRIILVCYFIQKL